MKIKIKFERAGYKFCLRVTGKDISAFKKNTGGDFIDFSKYLYSAVADWEAKNDTPVEPVKTSESEIRAVPECFVNLNKKRTVSEVSENPEKSPEPAQLPEAATDKPALPDNNTGAKAADNSGDARKKKQGKTLETVIKNSPDGVQTTGYQIDYMLDGVRTIGWTSAASEQKARAFIHNKKQRMEKERGYRLNLAIHSIEPMTYAEYLNNRNSCEQGI